MLVVIALTGICGTSYIMFSVFRDTAGTVKRETDLFATYEKASRAVRSFGELKYWLTDVAVSQLMNSERNAAAAQKRFRDDLTALRAVDPANIDAIGGELDELIKSAEAAADAYASDKRVVGNSLMADARRHLGAIDTKLGAIEAEVAAQSAQARELMNEASDRARRWLLVVLVVALFAAIVGTVSLLRTISRPLRTMHQAVVGLTAGDLDVTIPTDAPKEVAAVGHALHLFRNSISEINRLAAIEHKQRQILSTAIETIGEGFALFDSDNVLVVPNTRLHEIFPDVRHLLQPGARYVDVMQAIEGARPDGEAAAGSAASGNVREVERSDSRWVRINERHAASGETVVVFLDISVQKKREADLTAARDLAEDYLQQIEAELKTARDLQQGMVPTNFEARHHPQSVAIHGTLVPAHRIGGDLYDFVYGADGRLYFLIGDVCGKGVPAALYMTQVKTLFRVMTEHLVREGKAEAGALLAAINDQLAFENPALMFVTAQVGILDPRSGILELANGGHPMPIVIEGADASYFEMPHGMALGVDGGHSYQTRRMKLAPGSGLIIYTDGVTDMLNAAGVQFDETRLIDAVAQHTDAAPAELVKHLKHTLAEHSGSTEQFDDVTILALRFG